MPLYGVNITVHEDFSLTVQTVLMAQLDGSAKDTLYVPIDNNYSQYTVTLTNIIVFDLITKISLQQILTVCKSKLLFIHIHFFFYFTFLNKIHTIRDKTDFQHIRKVLQEKM